MPILCPGHLKCPKVETLSYGGGAASIREDFGNAAPASVFSTSPARSVAQVQIGGAIGGAGCCKAETVPILAPS